MLLVADNLQITKPSMRSAIEHRKPAPIQALVRHCMDAGADAMDINPGPLTRDAGPIMAFLVETVQAVAGCPVLLDTINAEALAAGLAVCRSPAIINGISLEPTKLERIIPVAAEAGADGVGYLLYPNGHVPPDLLGYPVRTIAGLSNLTSGGTNRAKKILLECAYLPMLADSGLTMVMMNMTHKNTVRTAKACDILRSGSIFTWEAL